MMTLDWKTQQHPANAAGQTVPVSSKHQIKQNEPKDMRLCGTDPFLILRELLLETWELILVLGQKFIFGDLPEIMIGEIFIGAFGKHRMATQMSL